MRQYIFQIIIPMYESNSIIKLLYPSQKRYYTMFFKRETYCVHHNFILLLASHSSKRILTKQYTAILRKVVEKKYAPNNPERYDQQTVPDTVAVESSIVAF